MFSPFALFIFDLVFLYFHLKFLFCRIDIYFFLSFLYFVFKCLFRLRCLSILSLRSIWLLLFFLHTYSSERKNVINPKYLQ
jgi:hypothetical protein